MKFLFMCLLVLMLLSSASSQTVNPKKISHLRVSEKLRERLVERLNQFIRYELSQQFDKQYDLLATKCPEYLHCYDIGRQGYAKQKLEQMNIYGTLLELKFTDISKRKLKDNCIPIGLIPKLRKNNNIYVNASSSIACLQDNDWFFRFDFVEI